MVVCNQVIPVSISSLSADAWDEWVVNSHSDNCLVEVEAKAWHEKEFETQGILSLILSDGNLRLKKNLTVFDVPYCVYFRSQLKK